MIQNHHFQFVSTGIMPLGTRAQTRKKRDREEEDADGQPKPPEFKRHNSKNSEVENLEDQGIEEERLIQQQNQQPSSSRRIPSVEYEGSDLNLRSSLLSVNQFESLSQRSRNGVEGEGEEQTGNRKELQLSKFQAILNADGHRLKIVVEKAGSEPNDILKVSFFQISCTLASGNAFITGFTISWNQWILENKNCECIIMMFFILKPFGENAYLENPLRTLWQN